MSIDEVDVVVGKGFILTAHGTDWDPWETQHLRDGVEPVLRHGPDHLLWALLDAIVDDYFPFIDRIGDVIDELQDEVVRKGSRETLERIFELKRDLMTIRRAVNPVREILNQLTNRELALIAPHEVVWFRDVYDHLIRLADEVDNQRELVSGTLDVYLSTVNNNLSVIMKRLTGVTVIIAGVGSIAGLFGMSEAGAAFQGGEAGGFWLVVLGSVGLAGLAAFVLRRIGWI
jgi:magnesium transporter